MQCQYWEHHQSFHASYFAQAEKTAQDQANTVVHKFDQVPAALNMQHANNNLYWSTKRNGDDDQTRVSQLTACFETQMAEGISQSLINEHVSAIFKVSCSVRPLTLQNPMKE